MPSDWKSALVAEQTLIAGKQGLLEARSPLTKYSVVFEDDGDTGFLYAIDTSEHEQPILDALHIYNVKSVIDRTKSSLFQMLWSSDGIKAALLIDGYPHAAFDFENRRGCCRTNFPLPDQKFTKFSHEWSDEVMKWFE